MLVWNLLFYLVAIVLCTAVIMQPSFPAMYNWNSVSIFIYVCLFRVNELVLAFYGDALPKKLGDTRKGLPIDKRERIILLTLAYIEIIVWFGLIYFAIVTFQRTDRIFMSSFSCLADAIFLSGVTLTSLGSNEFYAVKTLSRYLTLYEAMIGIVFIALGLAAYMGASDRNQSR